MRTKTKEIAKSKKHPLASKVHKKLLKRIATEKNWEQLNIDRTVKLQLHSLNYLVPQFNTADATDEAENETTAGCKVLFAGSVKGKKLAAKLIGKQYSLDVYRIDLSEIVTKYTNETEKNLEKLFETATEKNWILFFDEADALFGKRTDVKRSHDRYANGNFSFLFSQIKDYPGLIIFSSKCKYDPNSTFPVHFNTVIHFKKPS
jgi:ATPase family associated with various cellular activities (AAA)